MEYSTEDFINTLCLKNQLVNAPIDVLLDNMEEVDNYGWFIDTVNIMMDMDSGFLLLDSSYINKIETIIYSKRYTIKDSDFTKVINDIISKLNEISNRSQINTNLIKTNYLNYQEDCRKIEIEEEKLLIEVISYDAIVCMALEQGDLSVIDNPDYFLSTTNYLLASIPEIYQNEKIYNLTINKLEEESTRRGFKNRITRSYALETKEIFQKTKKIKEE